MKKNLYLQIKLDQHIKFKRDKYNKHINLTPNLNNFLQLYDNNDNTNDTKYNNGSNSVRAKTIRIKVIKIQAVKQLNQTGDKFSKSVNYWYYQPSGVIYDYDLHYAIGKISTDENNMPRKLNKFTFIIDKLIPIPMIKELK